MYKSILAVVAVALIINVMSGYKASATAGGPIADMHDRMEVASKIIDR